MKIFCLFFLLPLAFASDEKRFLETLLSSTSLSKYVNQIVDKVGSDATEQQCETACTEVITDALLSTSCPFLCQSFQSLVGNLHVTQAQQVQKRFLENLWDSASLSKYVNQIVDRVGSDATEQQCETACTEVITDALLSTSCPFLCQSFQSLVGNLHVTGSQPGSVQKRFLDVLSSATLRKYVNQIVDRVGSDATEQQCETACTEVITDAVFVQACPFICSSFQSLVNALHLEEATQSPVARRFLGEGSVAFDIAALKSILGSDNVVSYVNQIVDAVGSDATEQQCETACPDVMKSDLLDTACPFICNSFQALVNKLHVNPATPAPGTVNAGPAQ